MSVELTNGESLPADVISTELVGEDGGAAQGEDTSRENLAPEGSVGRGLLVARAFYFVLMFALAGFISFVNLFYESLGLTGTELGMIGAATALLGLFAMPFLSAVADMRQWHKPMLILVALAAGACSLLYLGITGFWGAIAVSLLFTFLRTPILPIVDSSVVAMLRRTGDSYGRQRVWGSVGFAAGAWIVAWLVGRSGFDAIFWVQFVAYGVLLAALSIMLPVERSTNRVNYGAGLRVLLKVPRYRALVALMIGTGIVAAMNSSYGAIHIYDLGGSAGTVGILFTLGALVEIPAMLSGDLMSRRVGMRGPMIVAGVGMAVMAALAGFAISPWAFVACMVAVSAFGGLIWSALAPLALQDAPQQLSATALGIVYMAFGSVGFAIGTMLGGVLLDAVGGGAPFVASSILMLVGTFFFVYSTRN